MDTVTTKPIERKLYGTITDEQRKKLDEIDKANLKDELKKNQEMGREQFLKVLMTQLAHQDPLSPLEDKDFIAQMAQFTSVESMQEMVKGMDELRAEVKAIKAGVLGEDEKVDEKEKTEEERKAAAERAAAIKGINDSLQSLSPEQLANLNATLLQMKAGAAYGG